MDAGGGSMPDDEKKDPGFAVTDRRVNADSPAGPAPGPEPPAPPSAAAPAAPTAPRAATKPLPEITFPTFLLSLSTSALIHLGLIPNPVSGRVEADLDLAKQTIDLLSLLKNKTQGNLDSEETQLLDSILYDLRMQYVEARQKGVTA
jgi:hypothetical protein